jgi:uncharacterized RDD family membrane protein YckC
MASSNDQQRSGLADAAGRAALFPARTAARAWRDQFESAVDEVLSAPEVARLIDHALATSLPDEVARSVIRHRVIERFVAELVSSGELERLLNAALTSPRAAELTDRVLASDATQHALRQFAASPAVREAIAKQTTGFAEEVLESVRLSACRLDNRFEQAFRRRSVERTPFAGIVTRALALAADAAATIGLYLSVVAIVALVASLAGGLRPQWLVGVLLMLGWILVAGGYFVLFWSSAGQTLGMRLFRLRVQGAAGGPPSFGKSIVRMVGLVVSIALLFLGFVPVLFDKRRRGLPDFLAGTAVRYDDRVITVRAEFLVEPD